MTLYHALSGKSPFYDITNDEELRLCKLARELPDRDTQLVSDAAWEVITQCCAPAPDQRPVMPKVLEALKMVVGQCPANDAPSIAATFGNSVINVEDIEPTIGTLVNAAIDIEAAVDVDQSNEKVTSDPPSKMSSLVEEILTTPEPTRTPEVSPNHADRIPVKSRNSGPAKNTRYLRFSLWLWLLQLLLASSYG
ncbi:hypothetical protein PC116_g13120 [Phytophthora cactorum]|uniref:Uncharacterized protein n=1 Tax=Phytophthora cactorum TaxID=29920 RepID=A0A8T1CRI7_9STRA|nr:hypothetical protein Pcac1_g3593 [Phytophthora cactorum]KAG2908288.1 hypothetical protein PC114_g10520 [Phytophthora cactorum]KAG2925606.1 hypothetical protein PC117_g15162 [Phytophthora cactorum]KAG3019497.1 hypothetical protein PC119_g10288 [Phytophthora cactorum]KAG3020602.1 hypothetical protein PC120_g9203 [Phytophthora cactorum]